LTMTIRINRMVFLLLFSALMKNASSPEKRKAGVCIFGI